MSFAEPTVASGMFPGATSSAQSAGSHHAVGVTAKGRALIVRDKQPRTVRYQRVDAIGVSFTVHGPPEAVTYMRDWGERLTAATSEEH